MEVKCKLTTNIRQLGGSVGRNQRPAWVSILLGTSDVKNEKAKPVFLIVRPANCTSGTKYRVHENIKATYGKFVEEGRATISFISPNHDILISNAEPVRLKQLIRCIDVLSKSVEKDKEILVPLPSLAQLQQNKFTPPIVKIAVNNQSEYQSKLVTSTIEFDRIIHLSISDCVLKYGSSSIRKMRNLKWLMMLNNDVRCSSFLHIESEVLSSINLNRCRNEIPPPNLFTRSNICHYIDSLTNLHLNGNYWATVPEGIFQFHNLFCLSLNNNRLKDIPDMLHSFNKLRNLSVSNNFLKYVPSSVMALTLDTVDFSGNPLTYNVDREVVEVRSEMPSLLELASRAVLNHKILVEEGMIPTTLVKRLTNSKRCPCGRNFVDGGHTITLLFNLRNIAATTNYQAQVYQSEVPVRGIICKSIASCFPGRFSRRNVQRQIE